jgi:hypothetical protein
VCSEGKYSNALASSSCTECSAGTISFTASTECDNWWVTAGVSGLEGSE